MTSHFDESIMIGILAISGSDIIKLRNLTIIDFESIRPSSMLTSIILAPLSACWRAIFNASSNLFSLINFANLGDPVIFVRSPTITKLYVSSTFSGSSPLKLG